MKGGDGGDTLNGGDGADYLYGQGGADRFVISSVAHSAYTGSNFDPILVIEDGIDKIDLSALGIMRVTSAASTNLGEVRYYLNSGGTITYLKSDQTDFFLSVNGNHLSDFDSSDFILAPSTNVLGTSSTDSLTGASTAEAIYGFAGNDTIHGGRGDDTIYGGAGADRLYGEYGKDIFKVQEVSHSINNSGSYDIIYGFEDGIDKIDLTGLGFTTLVSGSPGAGQLQASLNSNGTATYIKSNTATNFLISIDGNHLSEIDPTDFIFGPLSNYNGTSGNDSLTGSSGDDGIFAFNGDDTIHGGSGADTIIGGVGFDRLYGEAGADMFKFTDIAHSINSSGQYDRIYDFENGIDKIDLRGLGFASLVTSSPGAGELRASLSTDSTITYIKSDVTTNFLISISGDHLAELDNSDFVFV